jgi:phosphatidylglycerol:prolipoprotein diacylglycerol transferase
MHSALVEIPFIHVTIWSFGAMAVLGFIVAMLVARRMCRRVGLDPEVISSGALYSLVIGMVGARTFFVIHYVDQFRGDLAGVFAIWRGGLEFLGGAIPGIIFMLVYLRLRKLPVRRYFDLMAVALMLGLSFGRIGCFLNGCCFGRPAELPWAVRFPYRSYPYLSQINADPKRHRAHAYLELPRAEYLSFTDGDGRWYPKPLAELTPHQRYEVTEGKYRCLPVHPTQLYAWASALLISAVLYGFWCKSHREPDPEAPGSRFWRPGLTTALAFTLYGVTRPILESIRDDNPFEFAHLTISQIGGILLFAVGVVLLVVHVSAKPHLSGCADTGGRIETPSERHKGKTDAESKMDRQRLR